MTAFDVLMAGATAPTSTAGASSSRGRAGDWRQAVEQAQAKSWLGNRGVDMYQQPTTDDQGRGAPRDGGAEHSPPPSYEYKTTSASGSPLSKEHVQSARLPFTPRRAGTPTFPTSYVVAMPPAGTVGGVAFEEPPVVGVQEELNTPTAPRYTTGARPRKQGMHMEAGKNGLSIWVRDATLNSLQAKHLAAAIVASLGGEDDRVAALYLNGEVVATRSMTPVSLLSTKPSE